jgi:PHP family Zn ribbon phosphoesterase
MTPQEISHYAKIKGLNVVGTGDFTHPRWLEELRRDLRQSPDEGLYQLAQSKPSDTMRFILSAEVSTVFNFQNRSRKVHHVILAPDFDAVSSINERLAKFGDLSSDGRPTLDMSAPELVEEVVSVSKDCLIFPAHAWTPWFSVFGAFSGFDSLEECYQDMTKHIHALETGLSSDPPMNWRLSALDGYTLLSNSDSHSAWPWRMGREANVFDLPSISYQGICDAIRSGDHSRLLFTIETDPRYGKYHWTGHRPGRYLHGADALKNLTLSDDLRGFLNVEPEGVGFSIPPEMTRTITSCPICKRKLTKGVEERVEELADRPPGFRPPKAAGFVHLLPLSEIIATALKAERPDALKVWNQYNQLIARFGDEFSVLLEADFESIRSVTSDEVAVAIAAVRNDAVEVKAGYDGYYGRLSLSTDRKQTRPAEEDHRLSDLCAKRNERKGMNLYDFMS